MLPNWCNAPLVVQRCVAWACRTLVGAVMEQLFRDGACWPVALH